MLQPEEHQSLLEKYRAIDQFASSDQSGVLFPTVKRGEDYRLSHRNWRLVQYFRRMTRLSCLQLPEDSSVLLMDSVGVILDSLTGDAASIPQGSGFAPDEMWQPSILGTNAVTIGLREGCPFHTIGEDNQNPVLKNRAIYYFPIRARSNGASRNIWIDAGLAFVIPARDASPVWQTLAATMANHLVLNLHLFQNVYWYRQRVGQTSMTIQIDSKSGAFLVSHRDPEIFSLLGMPETEEENLPLEEFFDPLPANEDFWDIINSRRDVSDYALAISSHGNIRNCLLSSYVYRQPQLDMDGLDLMLTSDENATSQIASRIGNSALRSFDDIVTQSVELKSAIKRARLIAGTNSNILLLGESGVGKDIFAQAIHNASSRSSKPFVVVNCGSIPRDLIASELFGYDSGAFTGTKKQGNLGKFELANGGTIFLDEIGELPYDLQATLLRVVEQKQLQRLGSNKTIDIDVKIISATNADIPKMIENRAFRADLYFRLSTLQLFIPPLRSRTGDPVALAEFFIERTCKKMGRETKVSLSTDAKKLLLDYSWPGNVRELQNLMERLLLLYPDSTILPQHILDNLMISSPGTPTPAMYTFHTAAPADPYRRVPDSAPAGQIRPGSGLPDPSAAAAMPESASAAGLPGYPAASGVTGYPASAGVPAYPSAEEVPGAPSDARADMQGYGSATGITGFAPAAAMPGYAPAADIPGYSPAFSMPVQAPAGRGLSGYAPPSAGLPGQASAFSYHGSSDSSLSEEDQKLLKKRERLTRAQVIEALRACGGNRTRAAAHLGVSRKTLYRYLDLFESE